jgi:glycosyltransferase involved in cell wall biosynthesis
MFERHAVPEDKMTIIPNFLLAKHFTGRWPDGTPIQREPHHFFYASSPDRGLIALLDMWPAILKTWPNATLDVFYGWEGCKKLAAINPEWTAGYRQIWRQWKTLKSQPGVIDRGRVSHETIACEMQRAPVFFYPTLFEETGCLTAAKARAAGCVPVTHPIAALAETAVCPEAQLFPSRQLGEPFEEYERRCLHELAEAFDTSPSMRARMSEEAIDKYRLEHIAPLWAKVL